MSDGFTGFLKDVGDGVRYVPIVGAWVGNLIPVEEEHSGATRAIEKYFLKPGSEPIVKTMHALNWFYDNGISQPISTALLAGTSSEDSVGDLLKGSTWSHAWQVAEHVSPGQAFWADHDEVDRILENRPLYATPSESYLPPGWDDMSEDEQQSLLAEAGMPVIGNRAVEQMRRDHDWFTFASGATDFAFRWWLDPVVLAGKGIGAAREATMVQPRPKGGWTGDDIDRMMNSSNMAKAQDFLWTNRANPQLINNLSMFKKSALGPRAGGIISTLRSPEEVNLFMRTALGDVKARAALQERNALAAQRMDQDTARLAELDLALPRVIAQNNPRAQAMVEQRIDDLHRQVAADEALTSRYGAALAHYGELDALNLTRWSFNRAHRRTSAQVNYRTGPALGQSAARRGPLSIARVYANDFFGTNLVVVRSFAESHPNGLMAVDDIHPEAVDELRGHIARIPGIGPEIRGDLLANYLKTTTEGERLAQLEKIQALGVNKIAEKHGFTGDEARALYTEYMANIVGGQDKLRRYSAGSFPGQAVHLDEFMDGGGKLSVHPNLVTRLVNDQVMIDLKALDTTLKRHSSALKALRTSSIGNKDWLVNGLDYFNHLWKFGTLFRLGYIPRVLGDDIAGQVARLGAATMAARAGYGVKNLATNLAHWRPARHYEAQAATAREGLKYIDEELAPLQQAAARQRAQLSQRTAVAERDAQRARDRHRRAESARRHALPEDGYKRMLAHSTLVGRRAAEVEMAEQAVRHVGAGRQAQLTQLEERIAELTTQRAAQLSAAEALEQAAGRGFRQSSQLHKGVEVAPGTVLPAAFAGERGEYFMKMISSDDSLRTLLSKNKQVVHSNLQKAYGNQGVAISFPQDPVKFVSSWNQAINKQIMQDAFAVMAVKGASIDEMARWLTRTPQGRAYRKRLGIKYAPAERLAASVWHEVDNYLPTAEIRMAALEGKADDAFLKEAAEQGRRPMDVHTTQLGENLAGSNHMSKGLDRVVDWWYKWAASIPADRMSRHPLFNQLYEGHAKSLAAQRTAQASGKPVRFTQQEADDLAEAARRLALKDTRRLVFDIAHRSDSAHMLRFMSPFFAATTEAWQRWARIIADRPQTVGYATMFFNAPISAGWMQDRDGNKIMRDGTAMVWDEKAGKLVPKMVPKGDRLIMARVPKFIAEGPVGKAFSMDSSKRWAVSQDSMNLITQGDPFFNPGTGPIVAIPVNEFVKDKPKAAEIARHLGVLPFGPTPGSPLFGNTPLGRVADLSLPQTVKNFLTSFDTTDERYQRVKLQIMQQAAYEHAELGKPMPSAREIADRTRNFWLQSAAWSFVQPAATQRPDKYQFYRDQYNNLRRMDPLKADERFLERFGESYFIFAQATSKNEIGAEATKNAVELSKKFEQQIADHPELGALIIGPEGAGPFSPEAYTYQLTHPLVPGGSEMQRRKLDAEEAMRENQRRLGWAKFTQMQNFVTAELHAAGFQSFSDPGAEAIASKRAAIAKLYGEPLLPTGEVNPYYNEEWSKDFYSFDARKYDRLIPGLTAVAFSEIADNPSRTDLRSLQTYLQGRQQMMQELMARKAAGGAGTLKAKANSELAQTWARFVDHLREQDTTFGDLHSRYLSRDLGVDLDEVEAELEDMSDEGEVA
ncbi:hypothetical protein [Streptomyces sp. t39]|uniref:hypothetical protein n=1 Tax=Streptomyces sp. t39 TaxID=1828156 RepID=UPI0011CD370F|nr:hypothetical protein [Streptomyces sp. t39]TXS35063.1 hypothetical protein EAO77_37850 [Streptomyces sp. t39]